MSTLFREHVRNVAHAELVWWGEKHGDDEARTV
jgi:hypothetical protein